MGTQHYPMEGIKSSFLHQNGTKEYFLTLIVNNEGKGIVIRRWGSKGKTGQIKVTCFNTAAAAEKDFEKETDLRQSGSKSYQITDSKVVTVEAQDKLPLIIGRTVYPKMGPKGISHLDPDIDVSDIREPDNDRDEDGNFVGRATRPVRIDPNEVERLERENREKELEPMKANPKFGLF